jgi:hypothetical protein
LELSISPWPGIIVWSALYCSDWLLTLTCARLYRRGVSEMFVFEGSYEITPMFQVEVDKLRWLSPRFLIALTITAAMLWLMWRADTPGVFSFALGALICVQLTIHVRHFRNFFLFRAIARRQGVSGRIEYTRDMLLTASSFEILTFAALFFVVQVFTGSPFVLGGAIGCAVLGVQHWVLAFKSTPRAE